MSVIDELIKAAEEGDATSVRRLLSEGIPDPSDPKSAWPLRTAAVHGHAECLKLLIKDDIENNSAALKLAAQNGHVECVSMLIPVSNPRSDGSWALCRSAENGHVECTKLLIPVADPKFDDSGAIRYAAENRHTECVELLLSVSDNDAAKNKLIEMGIADAASFIDAVSLKAGRISHDKPKVRKSV